MRIVLLATGDATANARTMALAASLRSVGHDVTLVCGGPSSDEADVVRVRTRVPVGGGAVGSLVRRAQPESLRQRSFERRLIGAASALEPQLVYAANVAAVPLAGAVAEATGAAAVRDPRFPDIGDRDIAGLAPYAAQLSASPAGPGLMLHTSADDRAPWDPRSGRHAGRKIVIAYRPTNTTPARYLRAAMERAGLEVTHATDLLDWGAVDPDTEAVVFVESPYPALEIAGTNPGIPVLLWAHHGEHHTDAHLRLIARYGVDAVLLAHSWHLAHRYPVPVHRFPFAVAMELLHGSRRWPDRTYDLAFVGSTAGESAYGPRRELIEDVINALPAERRAIATSVAPEQMAALYGDARIVVNDGGTRHYPITMRVFEAIGSGAALLTTDAPGLELLFTPREHYRLLRPGAVAAGIESMLADPATAQNAESAYRHALGRHTYDHRVDELLAIAEATAPGDAWAPEAPVSEVARAIADDVDVSSIAAHGLPGLANELPLHAVWADPEPGARRYDAVALAGDWHGPAAEARGEAVRFIYIEPGATMPPERIDLKAPGYRIDPEDAP